VIVAVSVVALALAAVYAAFVTGMFIVMCQPQRRFGQIMRHFPMPLMAILPFVPLWNVARRGSTRVGYIAPDFTLPTVDRSREVTLSSYRGKQPVALVFGSYT
jgi:hypothetical protein